VKAKRSYDRDKRSVGKLCAFFGDRLLKDITPTLVEKYSAKRLAENSYRKHPTKPATVNRELACMKTIFRKAIGNKKAESTPFMPGMKLMLSENNARKKVLTLEEYPRLIAECPGYIEPVVKLAYYTGMRRGEILKLTWGMVDLLKRKGIDLPPESCKTNSGRFVPLNPEMVEMFKAMPRGLPGVSVFTRQGRPITGSTIRGGLEIACRRAGIEGFTFHDIRRTVKTNMLSAGVDPVYRDLIVGHKLQGMDVHYMAPSEDDLHRAMDIFTAWLDAQIQSVAHSVAQVNQS
jgi:integrase